MPRLKHSASTVEKALLTTPILIESRIELQPARILDQRPVVPERQFAGRHRQQARRRQRHRHDGEQRQQQEQRHQCGEDQRDGAGAVVAIGSHQLLGLT